MKIVLTTAFAILAIGLFGIGNSGNIIGNVFAQDDGK